MLLQMALFHSFYLVCCSFTKSYLTLYEPLDCSTPGPCPPLSPGVCSNSCPLSWWCHPTISSSAAPFSFCFLSFPGSRSFSMSQLFASGGQSTGASALASDFPVTIQGWLTLYRGILFSPHPLQHLLFVDFFSWLSFWSVWGDILV